jgi:hypothetical protein
MGAQERAGCALRELETDFGSRTRTTLLINNRQSGRRRGRGGGNGGGGGQRQGGHQGNGSRIDNRARGNANQLYEKYKNMAADAQRAGDRVNTEYYLQFADHYFRVLSEQRGRFEDQQPRRGRDDFDFDGDEEFGDEGEPVRAGEQGDMPRQPGDDRDGNRREFRGDARDGGRDGGRRERGEWRDRNDRGERRNGEYRNGEARAVEPELVAGQRRAEPIAAGESLEARAEEVLEHDRPLEPPAPRRRGRPRRDAVGEADVGFEGLPPALSAPAGEDGEEAPRRRRTRRPVEEAPTAAE